MIKVVVVEDSLLAKEGLIAMLDEFPCISVIGSAENAEDGLSLIHRRRPDALMLDIHLPGESGFELLKNLDYSPKVIFTTAYSEYAIRSFDFHTIDYLLKPISRDRLTLAIEKLKHSLSDSQASEPALDAEHRLFLKDGDRCHLVRLADIKYFESCKNYSQVYFGQSKAFVRKNLSQIESRLPDAVFFRANRQFIINLREVGQIDAWLNDGFRVTLNDGKEVDISRRHAQRLKELLSF